jgi:hypothetical protein
MPVPDFQTLMRPPLEEYAAGNERPIAEVRAALAAKFSLTPEELAQRLPSGLAKTFDNRVGWAATYLYRVGLLVRPRRSVYAITKRGREVLAEHPDRIDLTVLSQFPEFAEFRKARGTRRSRAATTPASVTEGDNPYAANLDPGGGDTAAASRLPVSGRLRGPASRRRSWRRGTPGASGRGRAPSAPGRRTIAVGVPERADGVALHAAIVVGLSLRRPPAVTAVLRGRGWVRSPAAIAPAALCSSTLRSSSSHFRPALV